MKILHISDVHSVINPKLNSYLDGNKIDLIIVSGDVTNFGPSEFALDFLNELREKNINVIAIPGNCDIPEAVSAIEDSDAIYAHNKIIKFRDLIIYGFGGSNPTPFDTPLEFDEDTLYKQINSLINRDSVDISDSFADESLSQLTKNCTKILLTHAPPHGGEADLIPGGAHVGSTAIEKIINEKDFDLNLCGHIHEAVSISKIANTIVSNPGNLESNHGVLIEVNKDEILNIEIVDL
ncbi:MAG: metallophosphoesterase [Methanobrevibacter sp.]|jgi:Icc-related predicted phosphoesterase|nr:metallophosphoesterase [Candidatus Methanoflexus mossambicus]